MKNNKLIIKKIKQAYTIFLYCSICLSSLLSTFAFKYIESDEYPLALSTLFEEYCNSYVYILIGLTILVICLYTNEIYHFIPNKNYSNNKNNVQKASTIGKIIWYNLRNTFFFYH